jgi:hypothetical protein
MRKALEFAACVFIAVLTWSCRESRSVTTTGEQASPPQAAASASPPATASASNAVVEQSVVPHDRADVGAVEVRSIDSSPVDWFDVLQNGKRAFDGNPRLLNTSVELPPGSYVVDVNQTQREVIVEAGKKTVLWTGNLVVEGEPSHAFWYPMQGGERKLSSNPPLLNRARALFPGNYSVYVYVSITTGDEPLGDAQVLAGQKTVLRK